MEGQNNQGSDDLIWKNKNKKLWSWKGPKGLRPLFSFILKKGFLLIVEGWSCIFLAMMSTLYVNIILKLFCMCYGTIKAHMMFGFV